MIQYGSMESKVWGRQKRKAKGKGRWVDSFPGRRPMVVYVITRIDIVWSSCLTVFLRPGLSSPGSLVPSGISISRVPSSLLGTPVPLTDRFPRFSVLRGSLVTVALDEYVPYY